MWKRPNNFTGRWRLCTFNIVKVASTKSRFLINLGEDPSTILTHEPMSVGASVNITPSLNAIIAFSSKHKVSNDRKINPMWEIFQGERPDPPHLDWRRQLSWWRFCRLNCLPVIFICERPSSCLCMKYPQQRYIDCGKQTLPLHIFIVLGKLYCNLYLLIYLLINALLLRRKKVKGQLSPRPLKK